MDSSVNQRFSSRWGFILSALGIAIGTGNIWRFPRIAAQNGGENGAGAFLVIWIGFLFLWSIPLIIGEYAIGRKYRNGVVGAFVQAAGKKFAWMGAFMAFVATAITFFYSVIVGWCIYYFVYVVSSPLPLSTAAAMDIWNNYQSSGWPVVCHAVVMAFGALAIWKGITSIERVNRILIPTLLVIVLLAVVRSLTLPGAIDGVVYLFTPDWSQLTKPRIWLEALTQNAFDTGAGWGLFLTYGAYIQHKFGIVKNAFITGIGNNMVSLLSAIMIFGTVFAVLQTEMGMNRAEILEIMKTSGPASTGLTFIWMPQLFARMFFGGPLAILFFLALMFAGFSSLIAQLELPTRIIVDRGVKRSNAILIVIGVSFVFGVPSAINLNILSNQDFVWGMALLISGAVFAFMMVKHGISKIRKEEILQDPDDWKIGVWWEYIYKYFIPTASILLLTWWFVLAADDDQWYNPLNISSIANCVLQWFLVITVLLIANKWISRKKSND
jgi:NSS family neurotransmitter:Na+ symporter